MRHASGGTPDAPPLASADGDKMKRTLLLLAAGLLPLAAQAHDFPTSGRV